MSRREYFSYSSSYEYSVEVPCEGVDGVEEREILSGEVTWGADITWNEALGKYEVFMTWNDQDNHFTDLGEGPKEADFIDDLYSYLEGQGIGSEEVTY